jgi:hypothetical protein
MASAGILEVGASSSSMRSAARTSTLRGRARANDLGEWTGLSALAHLVLGAHDDHVVTAGDDLDVEDSRVRR